MAEDQKGGLDAPTQSEEVRAANLRGVAPSTATASGLQARIIAGEEPERPENDGSAVPIAGGPPEPDLKGIGAPPEPRGAQAQVATYLPNGIVPAGLGPSTSGFASAGTLHPDPEQARKAHEIAVNSPIHGRNTSDANGPRDLTDEEIERADANILRAAALDRGYDLGGEMRGSRATRAAFRRAQREAQADREGEQAGGAAVTTET